MWPYAHLRNHTPACESPRKISHASLARKRPVSHCQPRDFKNPEPTSGNICVTHMTDYQEHHEFRCWLRSFLAMWPKTLDLSSPGLCLLFKMTHRTQAMKSEARLWILALSLMSDESLVRLDFLSLSSHMCRTGWSQHLSPRVTMSTAWENTAKVLISMLSAQGALKAQGMSYHWFNKLLTTM